MPMDIWNVLVAVTYLTMKCCNLERKNASKSRKSRLASTLVIGAEYGFLQ